MSRSWPDRGDDVTYATPRGSISMAIGSATNPSGAHTAISRPGASWIDAFERMSRASRTASAGGSLATVPWPVGADTGATDWTWTGSVVTRTRAVKAAKLAGTRERRDLTDGTRGFTAREARAIHTPETRTATIVRQPIPAPIE